MLISPLLVMSGLLVIEAPEFMVLLHLLLALLSFDLLWALVLLLELLLMALKRSDSDLRKLNEPNVAIGCC